MKIFIDFDDVSFNTGKFVLDLKKVFAKHGIDEKIFAQSYLDYPIRNKNGSLKKYDVYHHIDILENKIKVDVTNLRKDVDRLISGAKKYLFADVYDFVSFCGKSNVYVVSYGDTQLQFDKMIHSGLPENVKNVLISDDLKSKGVAEIIGKDRIKKSEAMYFLDDRIEQLEDVKKKFPRITTILVKRKQGRYNDAMNGFCDFEAGDLERAEKIIKDIDGK